MPASSSASSSSRPAGPTNGRPCEVLLVARLLADEHHRAPSPRPRRRRSGSRAPRAGRRGSRRPRRGASAGSGARARRPRRCPSCRRRFPRSGEATPATRSDSSDGWLCGRPRASGSCRRTSRSPRRPELVESYRRLADVFHEVLAEQSLDALLVRIADALRDLIPHDTLTIYEADEAQRGADAGARARPVRGRDHARRRIGFDEGITGWAASRREPVLVNQAHLDPRVRFVPGTPNDPEALISIPLVARAQIKGVLNIYRVGDDGVFTDDGVRACEAIRGRRGARARQRADPRAARAPGAHRLAHRPLQPPKLPRAAAARAAGGEPHAPPVAVLMLDIDDFKRVNDVHGHGVGDELPALLADTLRELRAPRRRRLPARRRGVRRDHALAATATTPTRVARAPRRQARRARLPGRRRPHRLGRPRARPGARDEPARAGRVRRGGDDDREGARQEPHRPLRRRATARPDAPRARARRAARSRT